jgi:hypothetical protein
MRHLCIELVGRIAARDFGRKGFRSQKLVHRLLDPGGVPLHRLLGQPLEVAFSLIATPLRQSLTSCTRFAWVASKDQHFCLSAELGSSPSRMCTNLFWLVDHGKNSVNLGGAGAAPVIELSRYVVEPLRKDENFILYRGRSNYDASQILVLSPLAECPAPEILKRLEHEYSLREELNLTWAVRPVAIARHWDRPEPI